MLTKLHMNSVATESAIARKLQKAANIKVYNANPIHVQQKSARNRLGPVNTNSIRSAGACIFRMKGIFGVV
ncbi:hypothetical protein TERTU_2299 [Teredinibacter turnerae T7901]|uniref:Uncharacterized protein n=1 Tax=Teredinibacter turnerae (strain ATCC 39867 / T7901) TaxID=377629 RepID=C5BK54_TERTT|nr:hypothetical protein TERTU_2299 [Teredinibacter turnerae T7901]